MSDREPLSPLEALGRFGAPSEFRGPVPCPGGPARTFIAARLSGWRVFQDTADDIAVALAATDESGDAAAFKRVIEKIDREINDLECYARRDIERSGTVDPSRLGRLDGLRARRRHLWSLASVRFTPPPI